MSLESTLTLIIILILFNVLADKIEIKRLHDLSLNEYENIFTANYLDSNAKHAQHEVHLVDELGKFIKLSYKAQHPQNTNILKLDETQHSQHIESVSCFTENNNHQMIKLQFKSEQAASRYNNDISASMKNEEHRHFISGSIKWGCINSETNAFETILHEITTIQRTDKRELKLSTQPANILDIFEELRLVYESNSNHNIYKTDSLIAEYLHQMHDLMHLSPAAEPESRRLSEEDTSSSLWRSMWPSLQMGLIESKNFFQELITESLNPISLTKAAMGYELNFGPKYASKTWSWNYNDVTHRALDTISIAENVTCINCYAHLDLTWKVEAVVYRRKLQSLSFASEGSIESHIEIYKAGSYSINQERVFRIEQLMMPDISFTVAGICFTLSIWGDVSVAVQSYLNYAFSVGISTSGHIKKGIQYNRDIREQYDYTNDDHLHYDLDGPKLGFETGTMNNFMYMRPLVYMRMSHLADVYFGIQPTFELYITNHDYVTCAVHYAPFLNLNQFLGGNLAMMDWKKQMDYGLYQSNIDNLGGCISKADLVKHSVLLSDVLMDDDGDIFYDAYDDFGRRRLINDDLNNINPVHYIDFAAVDLFPAFSIPEQWATKSLNWWGNLSTVDNICNYAQSTCKQHRDQRKVPQKGSLVLSASNMNDGSALIGIYRTEIQIDGSMFDNSTITTNVSCTARHRFDLKQNVFANDGMRVYNVTLLESYCDINISDIGIDDVSWICMISLPAEMKAIALDASFGSIVLFDARSWCFVFTLTTKPIYVLNASQVDWTTASYPSSLWYGVWDCEEVFNAPAVESRLYFLSFDYRSGETEAILYFNTNSSFLMRGNMDLIHMEMELVSVFWIEEDVYLNGSYDAYHFVGNLDLLDDGTIIYAGSVQSSGCTGFLFQGFLNLTQFERSIDDDIITTDIPVMDTNVTDIVMGTKSEIATELLSTAGLMMFCIGITTATVIFIFIFAFCMIKNKTIANKEDKYELMNDAQL